MGIGKNFFDVRIRHVPLLSESGKLHLGTKSDLLRCLGDHSEIRSDAPTVTAEILDGVVVVQMLKPCTAKTFGEYTN